MQGKIVKGISGFYYVHVAESGIYECKAKGIFRQQKIKPLVGDDVEIAVLNQKRKKTGNVAADTSAKKCTDPSGRCQTCRPGASDIRGRQVPSRILICWTVFWS